MIVVDGAFVWEQNSETICDLLRIRIHNIHMCFCLVCLFLEKKRRTILIKVLPMSHSILTGFFSVWHTKELTKRRQELRLKRTRDFFWLRKKCEFGRIRQFQMPKVTENPGWLTSFERVSPLPLPLLSYLSAGFLISLAIKFHLCFGHWRTAGRQFIFLEKNWNWAKIHDRLGTSMWNYRTHRKT